MRTCGGEDISVLCSPSVTATVRLWKRNAQESEIKRNRLESCQIEDGAKGESLNEIDGKLCVPQGLSGLKLWPTIGQGRMGHTCNPSTLETGTRGSLQAQG